jgi:hypothetical protein
MSIFVGEVLPCGVVFAADRNVTLTKYDSGGNVISTVQDVGTKILRWPQSRALVGFVGCARICGQPMHEWLYDFMGDHLVFGDPRDVAFEMRDSLQASLGPNSPASIIQFAAFARRGNFIVPEFWHITNVLTMTGAEYDPPADHFEASERLLGVHLKGAATPENIRDYLQMCSQMFQPFWFHQGIGLQVFNVLSDVVRQGFLHLQNDGTIQIPQTLSEWERYARMWVLIYGAYYEAFGRPGEKYVGGGADVLSIPWPDDD